MKPPFPLIAGLCSAPRGFQLLLLSPMHVNGNILNNLGIKFLFTCYSYFWWIPSRYILFLTVFNSYKLIRIFLPKFIIFLRVTHQRKNNFLDDCLLEGKFKFNRRLYLLLVTTRHMSHMITKYINLRLLSMACRH